MIQLTSITKKYQSGRGQVHALVDVTLKMPAGSFTAVMGKSGSGKSTLLNCIGGLELPESGSINCFGTEICRLSSHGLSRFQRQNMGFVFQRGNLLSYLTVAENIGFPLTLNGIGGAKKEKRIEAILARIDLLPAAKAMPHELSGGETQRVAVARAVAHHPKLLLADEPTASLDTRTGQKVVHLMQDLGRDFGCTIVMATHDAEITAHAEMTVVLKDGRIQNGGAISW